METVSFIFPDPLGSDLEANALNTPMRRTGGKSLRTTAHCHDDYTPK